MSTDRKQLVQCPRCRFRNPAAATACLACKGALTRDAGGSATSPPVAPFAAPRAAPAASDTAFGSSHGSASASGTHWPNLEEDLAPKPAPAGPVPGRRPAHDTTRRYTREDLLRAPEVDPKPTPSAGLSAHQLLAQLQAIARNNAAQQQAPAAQAPAPPPRPASRPPQPPTAPPQRSPAQQAPGRDVTQRLFASDVHRSAAAPPAAPTPAAPIPAPEPIRPPVSQVPRFEVDDPRIVLWLHCEPFTPVPVGPEPVMTLGRDPSCGLVLPHAGVSRTHGVVRVAGRAAVFEDRSTYGSYVNGERVLTHPLVKGDVLMIGPYEIKVRTTDEVRKNVRSEGEETRPLETFRSLPSSEAMSGRLEKSSLSEVLQAIEFNQKTGTLEVFVGEKSGTLVIYEGQPMFASFGELRDTDAVCEMVAQRRGYFTFRNKIEAGERTLKTTITGLLLEAGRRIDEKSAPQPG